MTLGHSDDIDHLILSKNLADGNLLLKVVASKGDLISNGASVQLDLHDVSLLLPATEKLHLGVDDDPDGGARLGEGLLLRLRPVLVEPPLALLSNVLSPDSLECPHAARSLNVSNNADGDHGRGLDDGHGFDNLLLVVLGAGTVHLANNVGHAGLESHEASQVDCLASIILGEGLGLTTVALGPLLWEDSLGPVTGSFELSVRHFGRPTTSLPM